MRARHRSALNSDQAVGVEGAANKAVWTARRLLLLAGAACLFCWLILTRVLFSSLPTLPSHEHTVVLGRQAHPPSVGRSKSHGHANVYRDVGPLQPHRTPVPAVAQAMPLSGGEDTRSVLHACAGNFTRDTDGDMVDSLNHTLLDRLACVLRVIYPRDNEEVHDATYGSADGAEHIYGEIPPESTTQVLDELGVGEGSVFYDLGSGIGHMVLQAFLTTPVLRAVGVEISEPRHRIAAHALRAIDYAHLKTLLPEAPAGARAATFLYENITRANMSDATGIYMSSLYFSKDSMWTLARKFATELRDGTRICSLLKFPFDDYGTRRLAADSPMQALRFRKKMERIPMSWSKENTVFVYEVDRVEAFRPPFDGKGASAEELVDEIYRRLRINRAAHEDADASETLRHIVMKLTPVTGDHLCELGTRTGWLSLRVMLDTQADRAMGVSIHGANGGLALRARKILDELASGRLSWFRRLDFAEVRSLEEFVTTGDTDAGCSDASILTINATDFGEGSVANALAVLSERLPVGAVVLATGSRKSKAFLCTFGLLPVLERPVNIGSKTVLTMFVVAPNEAKLASLHLPGFSSLRFAVGHADVSHVALANQTSEQIWASISSPRARRGGSSERLVSQSMVRDYLDSARFKRLQRAIGGGGLVGYPNGTLEPLLVRGTQGIVVAEFARFFLARFFGGMLSPYMCLHDNVFGHLPEDGREDIHPVGVEVVMKSLGGLSHSDVFFDLGSGDGSVALQVLLATNASRVVFVEPDERRNERAAKRLATLARRYPTLGPVAGRLELIRKDTSKVDLSEATVVWLGVKTHSKETLDSLAIKLLERAGVGTKVLSVQPLPTESMIIKRKLFSTLAHSPIPARQLEHPEDVLVNLYEVAAQFSG